MLPLKWRIFRIASYLHMAGTVVIAALAMLRKAIRRNYEASLNNFLDNDQA